MRMSYETSQCLRSKIKNCAIFLSVFIAISESLIFYKEKGPHSQAMFILELQSEFKFFVSCDVGSEADCEQLHTKLMSGLHKNVKILE
jgi:hypothetical protein